MFDKISEWLGPIVAQLHPVLSDPLWQAILLIIILLASLVILIKLLKRLIKLAIRIFS
jgi:hypothetical protein